jgi:hypothetical protein
MRTSSGVPLIVAPDRFTGLDPLNPLLSALNVVVAHVFTTESTGMKICLARSMISFKKIRVSVATWNWRMKSGRKLKQLKKRQIGPSLAGAWPETKLKLSAKRIRIGERERKRGSELFVRK